MKVAVDARVFCEPYPTGVTRSARLQLNELVQHTKYDWQIHSYGMNKPNLTGYAVDHVHHKLPNRLVNIACATELVSQKTMFGDFDVLWQPNPMFSPAYTKSTIVTIHDLSVIIWPEFFELHTRSWYNRIVVKLLKNFNHNIWLAAVSERTKRDIELFFPHWKDRVEYIPSVPPRFKTDTTDLQQISMNDPYIVALSTLEPRKNMSAIYRAHERLLSRYPNLKLVIIGHHKQNVGVKTNNSVIMTDYLTEDKKIQLLAGAECLIYPSYYEGYGYPPLEALAIGVPAIVSSAGALPETLGNGVLYVNPSQAEGEIYSIVLELISNSQWRQKLVLCGKKQLKYLQDSYSVQPMINLIEKCASV